MSRMTTNNDDHSKENGRLSTTSKISSMKFGDGEEESHFNAFARQNSFHETESHLNPRFNDRSEGTTLNHFQTRTSNFSSVPPQINHDLDDAQAIIDKIDQPKELLKAFEAYQPKNKEIDLALMRKSERTKIKKYKNSVFLGEFLNGKRHGKGILISMPLKVYEGDWENDVKHGKGLEILDKGSRYEGSYSNGKPEGFGTFQWGNGESYEGEWKIGLKHGSGMWKGTKGESYLGEWKYGKAEGYGVHTWRNGDKYEGEFKGFLKHGHGTEKFVNGDYYLGNYVNGKPDGFGEYYWSNGCHYKGDFKNGLRHGKGVWKKGTGNGDFYEGEWANDKKNGTGVYKWASGNRYLGCYFDDIRHGYGEMYWTDGSAYKGFWEKGIQHGEGQLIMPGKGNKRGIFDKNILVNDVETGGTEQDLFNNSHGEDTTVLRESDNRNRGQAATPNRYSQNKPPKRVIPRVNDYNSVTDQNRNNESGLPDIRHSVKGTGYSIQLQEKEKRRNSSSVGPKRVLRDPAMGKLEAQNKSGEYGAVKKIPNLNSMSINDNVRRIANIAGTVKAK